MIRAVPVLGTARVVFFGTVCYNLEKSVKTVVSMKRSYIKYLLSLIIFGTNGILADMISLSSYEIVFLRTLIGTVFLLLLFFIGRRKFTFHRNSRDTLFVSLSGVAMGLSWILLYEAYKRIGVSVATLLHYIGPILVITAAVIIFREKLTAAKLLGITAVMGGTVLLTLSGETGISGDPVGYIIGISAAFMYCAMVILNTRSRCVKGLEATLIQLTSGLVTVFVFMLFLGGPSIAVKKTDILPILLLGTVNTGLGCYMYFSSFGELPVQTVAVCGYLEPLAAVIFAGIFLSETMSAGQIVGGVLIIGGAIFAELMSLRQKNKSKKAERSPCADKTVIP